jgi:GT2 family glycosyltransferase
MNSLPHVAIAILNYNGKYYLEKNLPSVFSMTYSNTSIVVIDNGSTDASVDWLRNNYPEIKVIKNNKNLGFAEGYNNGLKEIKSDYYLLLNTDIEVTDYLVQPMVQLLERDNKAAACQPKILSQERRKYFEYAGAAGGMIDSLGYPFARGRIFYTLEEDLNQYDDEAEIFWASGCCLLIKTKCYWEANGFYEYYFMQSEEIDLCWRLKKSGYKIFYTGKAWVYHQGGAHLSKEDPNKNLLNFRNNWVMMYRNLPNKIFWFQILPFRLILDISASFFFLFKMNFKTFLSVHRGLFEFWKWWFRIGKKQKKEVSSFKELAGVYKGCIIFDYFLRNKKTFYDL